MPFHNTVDTLLADVVFENPLAEIFPRDPEGHLDFAAWVDSPKLRQILHAPPDADSAHVHMVLQRIWAVLVWYRQGAVVCHLKDTYAAALMLTDPPEQEPNLPWDSFLLCVPESLRKDLISGVYVTHILVVRAQNGYEFTFANSRQFVGSGSPGGVYLDWAQLSKYDQGSTVTKLAFRLIANLCCAADNEPAAVQTLGKPRDPAAGVRKANGKPNVQNYLIGRPVRCDFREYAREWLRTGRKPKSKMAFRFAVRGHWRNQAHGANHAFRRYQWIEPYMKGAQDAPLLVNPKRIVG